MLILKQETEKAGVGGFALEGLIFDLDGTLIDSVGIYYTMMESVFERLHWPRVSREDMRKAIKDDGFEWVEIKSRHRLRPGMFVAQVVGKSMEPAIPDGSYCLFRAPVEGTRQGKTVLVQLRDATDPETGQRFTVKRYESEKIKDGDSWRHAKITLKPVNPDFEPIVLASAGEGELQVIAELVEVLSAEAFAVKE